jgi:hypothetical protein
MKRILTGMLAVVIFAAPCTLDIFSKEPSPLTSLVAVVAVAGQSHW